MFEIGDSVRIAGDHEVFTVVGIGPTDFYRIQLGSDGASLKYVKGSDLELVAKAKKPQTEPGFVPDSSITDVGY